MSNANPSSRVTWRTHPAAVAVGQRAVLSGGVPLTGWVPVSAGPWAGNAALANVTVYQTQLPAVAAPLGVLTQIWGADGGRRRLASTAQLFAVSWVNETMIVPCSAVHGTVADMRGALLSVAHAWAVSVSVIADFDPASCTITIAGPMGDPYNPIEGLFSIQNMPGDLTPGTFLYNSSSLTITYAAMPGEAVVDSALIAEALPVVTVINSSNIVLQDVAIVNGAWHVMQCISSGCNTQAAADIASTAVLVDGVGLTGVVLDNLIVNQTGGWGILLNASASSVSINNCELTNTGAGLIRAVNSQVAPSVMVVNNTAVNFGQLSPGADGILLQSCANCVVANNEVAFGFHSGIATGWTWGFSATPNRNITIQRNLIHDLALGVMSDLGCIYNLGMSPGTVIDNNVCHDVHPAFYGGCGIYLDEGSSFMNVTRNIVYNTTDGLHLHYGVENWIENNVWAYDALGECEHVHGCYPAEFFIDPGADSQLCSYTVLRNIAYLGPSLNATAVTVRTGFSPSFNGTFRDNIYWSAFLSDPASAPLFNNEPFSTWQQQGRDAGSLLADPQFVNASAGDFTHLKPTSPAITQLGFVPIDTSKVGPQP